MADVYKHPTEGFESVSARVERNGIIVVLEWHDEGWNGDYDQNDQEDCPFLRFSVYRRIQDGEMAELDDASYCTLIPATILPENATALATFILDKIFEPAREGLSIKNLCEQLSWISPSWLGAEEKG